MVFIVVNLIKKDSESKIIHPFNAIYEKIQILIQDPMRVVSAQFRQMAGVYSMMLEKNNVIGEEEDDNDADVKKNEMHYVDMAIFKISYLLILCYGEAGANLVSRVIQDEARPVFEVHQAEKTVAIFGFCDIRNFTDATEILQEDVMTLVNQVANIVHSNVIKYGGQPNKNIGDAFLFVWKISKNKKGYRRLKGITHHNGMAPLPSDVRRSIKCIADLALFSVLRTISNIYNSREMMRYNENPLLRERIKDFRIKLGFGLHMGWAIEGMIGSGYKMDASYLSPHVNIAARLEGATKQYGTDVLLSSSLY